MDARKDLYAFAMKGKENSPAISDRASEKIDAYRAAVLLEAANALALLGLEDSLASAPKAWTEAIETLRRMADEKPEATDV
jgi:hypothetical protein